MGFQLGVWGLVFIHPLLYKLWPCWAAAAALNGMVRRDLKWDGIDRSVLSYTLQRGSDWVLHSRCLYQRVKLNSCVVTSPLGVTGLPPAMLGSWKNEKGSLHLQGDHPSQGY